MVVPVPSPSAETIPLPATHEVLFWTSVVVGVGASERSSISAGSSAEMHLDTSSSTTRRN